MFLRLRRAVQLLDAGIGQVGGAFVRRRLKLEIGVLEDVTDVGAARNG